MSVIVRDIGGRPYAYNVVREGGKVRHIYLGRADNASVAGKIAVLMERVVIPEKFHRFFWDTDPRKIDLRRHKKYVIERILELGNLSAFQWLQLVYPGHLIRRVNEESRSVSKRSRNFWRIWIDG